MGLIYRAIEFGQHEHVQSCTSSKKMWDHLHQLYVTQRQDTNIHYYFQKLYLKKWNECTLMSNYICSFLNLKCCIVKVEHKLEDILVIYVMELHWDYNYYQLQTDNKWIVEKIIAIKDKEDKDNTMNDVLVYQNQVGLQT